MKQFSVQVRASLTRWKSPQGALDIQQHLVVILVIVPLYRFWKTFITIRIACLHLLKHWQQLSYVVSRGGYAYEIHVGHTALPACVCVANTIPGSWSRTWRGTLRSHGQTWQRISSVSSPPSLIAILRKAATSTGFTRRACVMSAIFLFRLVSQSETQKMPCFTHIILPVYTFISHLLALFLHAANERQHTLHSDSSSDSHKRSDIKNNLDTVAGKTPHKWLPWMKTAKVNLTLIVTVIHRRRGTFWILHISPLLDVSLLDYNTCHPLL